MIDRPWNSWRDHTWFSWRKANPNWPARPDIAGRVKQTKRTKRLKVTLPKLRFTEREQK